MQVENPAHEENYTCENSELLKLSQES